MAFEQVGVEAVLAGIRQFQSDADRFNSSVGGMARTVKNVATAPVRALSGFLSSLGDSLRRVGEIALGIIVANTIGRLGDAIRAVGEGIITMTRNAGRIQELDVVLELLGKRAGWTNQQIQDNVRTMQDLGIRGDVARETLAQFARFQLDAADATNIARVAQDAAVLSMQDSSDTLDQLLHGILTQNSLVLRNAGLNVQAGQAMEAYAESIGKTRDELTSQERIQAVLNAVMEEGERISGAYVAAMGTAEKQLRSLRRHFFEAGASIGKAFLPAFTDVIEGTTEWIKGIRTMLEEGKPLHTFFQNLGEQIASVTGAGVEFITTFLDKMFAVLTEGGTLGEALLGGFELAIETLPEELQEPLQNAIDTLLAGIKGFEEGGVFGLMEALGIDPDVVDTIEGIVEDITGAFNNLKLFWEENGPAIMAAVQQVFDALFQPGEEGEDGFLTTITQTLVDHGPEIVSTIQGIADAITNDILPAVREFMAFLKTDEGQRLLEFAITLILVKNALQTLAPIILTVAGFVALLLAGFGPLILAIGILVAIVAGAILAFTIWRTEIETWLNETDMMFEEWFRETIAGFINWGLTNLATILQWIADAKGALSGSVSDFLQIGKDIIQGIIDGINAKIADLRAAALEAAAKLPQWMRDLLGMTSPSKVFAEIGKNAMEGLAQGMLANMNMPQIAAHVAAVNVTAPMAQAAAAPTAVSNQTTNNFNLTVNSSAPQEPIIQDFNVMKSLTNA